MQVLSEQGCRVIGHLLPPRGAVLVMTQKLEVRGD